MIIFKVQSKRNRVAWWLNRWPSKRELGSSRGLIFILGIERRNKAGLFWFCFAHLCDWSRKPTPLPRPIRFKTKTNRNLAFRVFLRLNQFSCFYFESSLAPYDALFSFFWLVVVNLPATFCVSFTALMGTHNTHVKELFENGESALAK